MIWEYTACYRERVKISPSKALERERPNEKMNHHLDNNENNLGEGDDDIGDGATSSKLRPTAVEQKMVVLEDELSSSAAPGADADAAVATTPQLPTRTTTTPATTTTTTTLDGGTSTLVRDYYGYGEVPQQEQEEHEQQELSNTSMTWESSFPGDDNNGDGNDGNSSGSVHSDHSTNSVDLFQSEWNDPIHHILQHQVEEEEETTKMAETIKTKKKKKKKNTGEHYHLDAKKHDNGNDSDVNDNDSNDNDNDSNDSGGIGDEGYYHWTASRDELEFLNQMINEDSSNDDDDNNNNNNGLSPEFFVLDDDPMLPRTQSHQPPYQPPYQQEQQQQQQQQQQQHGPLGSTTSNPTFNTTTSSSSSSSLSSLVRTVNHSGNETAERNHPPPRAPPPPGAFVWLNHHHHHHSFPLSVLSSSSFHHQYNGRATEEDVSEQESQVDDDIRSVFHDEGSHHNSHCKGKEEEEEEEARVSPRHFSPPPHHHHHPRGTADHSSMISFSTNTNTTPAIPTTTTTTSTNSIHTIFLPDDTYSFLVFSRHIMSLSLAMGVAMIQFMTMALLLVDVINLDDDNNNNNNNTNNNPLNIPPAVTIPVALCQLIALFSTLLFSMQDLVWALIVQFNGYDKAQVQRCIHQGYLYTCTANNRNNNNNNHSHKYNYHNYNKHYLGKNHHLPHETMDVEMMPLSKQDPTTTRETTKEQGVLLHVRNNGSELLVQQQQQQEQPPPQPLPTTTTTPTTRLLLLTYRWYTSNALRFLQGCFSFVTIFVLIVRSDTVLKVVLNCLAVNFISRLDNLVFVLCRRHGYYYYDYYDDDDDSCCCCWGQPYDFGWSLKCDANHKLIFGNSHGHDDDNNNVDHVKFKGLVNLPHDRPKKKWTDWACGGGGGRGRRRVVGQGLVFRLVLVVIALLAWLFIWVKQMNGDYLVEQVYVQMGDEIDLTLGTYSGVYVRSKRRDKSTKRFRYVTPTTRTTTTTTESGGEFVYCNSIHAWIFRDNNNRHHPSHGKTDHHECGWRIRSDETNSFDLLDTLDKTWYLHESDHIRTPIEYMYLSAYNSNKSHRRPSPSNLICQQNQQQQSSSSDPISSLYAYGLHREFRDPCPVLAVDRNTASFGHGHRAFATEFTLLEHVEFYHRPVYYGTVNNNAILNVLVFSGRRWLLASPKAWNGTDITNAQQLQEFFCGDIPQQQRQLLEMIAMNTQYLSESVDATMEWTRNAAAGTPTGLFWFRTSPRNAKEIQEEGPNSWPILALSFSARRVPTPPIPPHPRITTFACLRVNAATTIDASVRMAVTEPCVKFHPLVMAFATTILILRNLILIMGKFLSYVGSISHARFSPHSSSSSPHTLSLTRSFLSPPPPPPSPPPPPPLPPPVFDEKFRDCCMSTCNDESSANTCGMDRQGLLDMKNVICSPDALSNGWNSAEAQPNGIIVPNLNGFMTTSGFGLSVATTWRGSLVAIAGMDEINGGHVALYRQASDWHLETATIMRSRFDAGSVVFPTYGLEVQMADIVPNAVANVDNRMPVHVVTLGEHINDLNNSTSVYLDALYCPSRVGIPCRRPTFVFDRNFYDNNAPVSQGRETEEYVAPPTTTVGVSVNSVYSTFTSPLPFSLSRDGRYLALGYQSMFTVQEWQVPHSSNSSGSSNTVGAWVSVFGTKRLGLDKDDMAASILYLTMSDGLGQNQEEIVIAVGMIRSKQTERPIAVPLQAPTKPVEGRLHVVMYRWVKGSVPTVLGEPLQSDSHLQQSGAGPRQPFPRNSVQLSLNGQVLLVSSYFGNSIFEQDRSQPTVNVYKWLQEENKWELRQSFPLETDILSRVSHSMSWDGSVVAIAESHRVVIYRWNTDTSSYMEERSFAPVDDNPHAALAGDASTLFVGSPTRTDSGSVQIYRDDHATQCRSNQTHPLLMHVSLRSHLDAMQWRVVQKSTSKIVREGGPLVVSQVPSVSYDALSVVVVEEEEEEAHDDLRSFSYQECFATEECSSMNLAVSSNVTQPASSWYKFHLAFFNGQNLTEDSRFNAALPSSSTTDCELIVEF